MTDEIAVAAARIAILVDRELAGDAVELWTLYWHAHRILDDMPHELSSVAAEVAMLALIREGVRVGELDDATGEFRFLEASDLGSELMARIRWLEHEPNMGDVGWLVKDVLP